MHIRRQRNICNSNRCVSEHVVCSKLLRPEPINRRRNALTGKICETVEKIAPPLMKDQNGFDLCGINSSVLILLASFLSISIFLFVLLCLNQLKLCSEELDDFSGCWGSFTVRDPCHMAMDKVSLLHGCSLCMATVDRGLRRTIFKLEPRMDVLKTTHENLFYGKLIVLEHDDDEQTR